jgi:hypothetical protein
LFIKTKKSQSCGCLNREIVSKKQSLKPGECAFNELYGHYRASARKKNHVFNISKDQFREITKQNCYYCGSEPSALSGKDNVNGGYLYNGMDRVNNSIGYEINNVVPCCKFCNSAKKEHSKEYFLNYINKIYLFQNNKKEDIK